MAIERWECEHCGDIYDSEWECENHEEDCMCNSEAQLKKLLTDKCATCFKCSMNGFYFRYYAPECKLTHKSLPVAECDMYEPSNEIPQLLRYHHITISVEKFKGMLAQ